MSNQGCKDGYKTKILAYLKENTNSKNKASILKIRDAIYQEENGYDPLEKEREKIFDKNEEENPASKEYDGKKKNHDTSSFRTIKKNVRALYEEGLIEVEDSEEPGYVRENKKECIYYKQTISAERFPLLVEQIIGMSNIRQDEKDEIINEILDSVGKANVKKYWMYIERTSPEYSEYRYLIFCDNVYSGKNFNECFCKAGYMLRDWEDSGQVYEPKTVKSAYRINCESTFAYLFGIDLLTNEFIWLNIAKDGNSRVAGDTTLSFLTDYFHLTEIINMYDFFSMMAEKIVDDPMEAEVIVTDHEIECTVEAEIIREYDFEKIRALMETVK